jgi:hypothetical protein
MARIAGLFGWPDISCMYALLGSIPCAPPPKPRFLEIAALNIPDIGEFC